MRVMRAGFGGYKDLKLVDIPKSAVSGLRHWTTPFYRGHPRAKAPLVLGGEGAGVVERGGGAAFPVGSRVMFTGPYGVSENRAYSEWLVVRNENLCLIPVISRLVHPGLLQQAGAPLAGRDLFERGEH
jgi:NADPH:quinone reductase-like Zn-dependent oxidoreductase